MKYLVIKIKKRIEYSYNYEFDKLKLKVLFWNTKLPFYIRQKAYVMLAYLNLKFRSSQIKYACIRTYRFKYVLKFFKLYRFQLKLQFYKNNFVGLKKKSF